MKFAVLSVEGLGGLVDTDKAVFGLSFEMEGITTV